MQKRQESRLQACEMRYLRRVEGLTKMDQVRNEEIRKEAQPGGSGGNNEKEAENVEGESRAYG